jgi:adenine-specific DNA methylase
MIDRWFPVAAVDEACATPAGSGRIEKAIFTWFASRPIAQARAAVLTSLLPPDPELKPLIESAIREGDSSTMDRLAKEVTAANSGKAPVVVDMFSGRAIIPLEAARAGATAIGIDLSPVATLAGRLLADYPARDWSAEPALPFAPPAQDAALAFESTADRNRLARDVEAVLTEIGRRVRNRMEPYYPRNADGAFPWGYLWAITLPCDNCKRRFPLLGSLILRYPCRKANDPGQSLRLLTDKLKWSVAVIDGPPVQQPTYAAGLKADGKKKKGKTGRCPFCSHPHSLETIKAKGEAREYEDALIAVADVSAAGKRFFRSPTTAEETAASACKLDVDYGWPYTPVPKEVIPPGNVHTVMPSGYGYKTFGELMCDRQTLSFLVTVDEIRKVAAELHAAGLSDTYAGALTSYAASVLCKRLRRSTRGVRILQHGALDGSRRSYEQTSDLFSNEAAIYFQFDFFEAGPGDGAGTWSSVSKSAVQAIAKVLRGQRFCSARVRMASATALPVRDASVEAVITDPPYYDMVEYADASDLLHVWLKRALFDVEPDLFGADAQQPDGLQDKNQEIIVRRVHEPNRVRHDKDFYESMLARSFSEARRVLKPDGHLVVVFGHSDPDAWKRLLGALQTAGFIVTSAWPSRTESADTGVASIKVTVTIGCRVAPVSRPIGMASEVDRDVVGAVMDRVSQWDSDGLALEDQLMASYGPAMEVYGRYARVINPDGSDADLDRYLTIARRAVRDAMRLRVDELPLETFDAITRLAVFWLRAKGRAEVPKGEARFFAQADELRLSELRDRILAESQSGFRLRLDAPGPVVPSSSVFEVVRAMAHAWEEGGTEAVAEVIGQAGREASDQHLWAVVGDLASHLPASDKTAKALAGVKRTSSTISTLVGNVPDRHGQSGLFAETEE